MNLLEISRLRVELESSGLPVVDDISLHLGRGEIVGLVGESGCGKSTVSTALMGYARRGVAIAAGEVRVAGIEVLSLPEAKRRELRGKTIAYIPQDPATALNPALKLRTQLLESLEVHSVGKTSEERLEIVRARLEEVGLPATDEFLNRFSHQLSGGQQQRVSIAIAFACEPEVLICDEPTTGLDVSTQKHVLDTIQRLARDRQLATLYISHDLAVVSQISHRVAVMYAGRIVEQGPVEQVFANPRHPYSRALLSAIPRIDGSFSLTAIPGSAPRPNERSLGCAFASRCANAIEECEVTAPPVESVGVHHQVACYNSFTVSTGVRTEVRERPSVPDDAVAVLVADKLQVNYGPKPVLHDVSLTIRRGECIAVVGESGSGKTTLSRTLSGLVAPVAGSVLVHGESVKGFARDRTAEQRRRLQIVFQNPYGSLNPRRTIGASVEAPARYVLGLSGTAARARALEALDMVALRTSLFNAYPDQLSGGERQRAAIARALLCEPDVLICDEVTSALDVSIQASIINLLVRLKYESGVALLFVTHNLPLVATLADKTLVLYRGRVVEVGATAGILAHPTHDYTKSLLADTPQILAAELEQPTQLTEGIL